MRRIGFLLRQGRLVTGLALIALVTLAGCVQHRGVPAGEPVSLRVAPGQAPISPQSIYRLQAGDTVSVFVFDNPELSRTAVVAPDGRLSYPLAGTFTARGRTVDDVRRVLAERFSESIVSPQVTVSLVSVGSQRVFVTGEVVRPGAVDIVEPVTLVQAIALSGGLTAFARRDRILVYNPRHPGGARRIFDYDRFVTDAAAQDVVLLPGDTIIVE